MSVGSAVSAQEQWSTFAFASGSGTVDEWSRFDWDKLTTVAIFGELNEELINYALARDCRVVHTNSVSDEDLDDPDYLEQWINDRILDAATYDLRGINLDYEGVVAPDSERAVAYTQLVEDLTAAFHDAIPGSEVSVDVAWKQPCIDGRCYDYEAIGQLADLVFGNTTLKHFCVVLCKEKHIMSKNLYERSISTKKSH